LSHTVDGLGTRNIQDKFTLGLRHQGSIPGAQPKRAVLRDIFC